MATSLGYVLMNWTSTFNKKKRQRNKNIPKDSKCCQTIEMECSLCEEKSQKVQSLTMKAQEGEKIGQEIRQKLNAANSSLAGIMDVEARLRQDHEELVLQEAQVRYELDQLRKQFSCQLEERDQAHADRVRTLEQCLQDKECEWAHTNEALRRDLRQAIRCSMADTEREAESLGNLEQEIESLKMVIEMRSNENRQLRVHNNQLLTQLERLSFLESELANSRLRLDEMTMVLQNKMDSEKELLELSETLQQELVRSRAEIMQCKKNIENRQYLQEHEKEWARPPLKVQHSHSDMITDHEDKIHRNQHQQASSGNNLIVNVREKQESVAWMIQMPTDAPSPNTHRRNVK